jgi:hypothetical protein
VGFTIRETTKVEAIDVKIYNRKEIMHNTHFQQYLTRPHALGELGIAMADAKAFLPVYATKKEAKEAVQDLSNDLTHLQGRWSSINKN